MTRKARFLYLLFLGAAASALRADVAAIHAAALPQETAVLAAFDDARAMEPYSRAFSDKWQYPVAKDEVTARLGKDLGFLRAASKAHPENVELQLLTGLVAHYAYNLDVDGSYEAAMDALKQAETLSPSDVRAPWFRSALLCQTGEPKTGADGFLAIEAGHSWDKLPAAFWNDYLECAWVTNMPAHVRRAVDHLEKLQAPPGATRTLLKEEAAKKFDAFDPKKNYEPKEMWAAKDRGDDTEFTSTTCGVRFRVHAKWAIDELAWKNQSCVAYFSTGPYQATVRQLRPSILLLVQRPEEGETLEDYAKKFLKKGSFEPFAPSRCPAERCIALKQNGQGMYGKDGDGHGRVVIFERDEPEFPGVALEVPWQMPKAEGKKYYHANQVRQRIPGKLYYVVLLDAAASIEEPAMQDFDFFLKNLAVE